MVALHQAPVASDPTLGMVESEKKFSFAFDVVSLMARGIVVLSCVFYFLGIWRASDNSVLLGIFLLLLIALVSFIMAHVTHGVKIILQRFKGYTFDFTVDYVFTKFAQRLVQGQKLR